MATDEKKTNATSSASEGDDVTKLKEELKDRDEKVADLTGKVSDLQATIISPQYQEYMKAQNQPQTFQPTDFAAGRTGEGELDLESLDRKQFSQYLLGEIEKRISPRIDQVSQNVRKDQLQRGIKDARGKFKDFDNYKSEMGKIALRLEAGDIRADDLYKLVSWKAEAEKEGDKGEGTTESEKPTTGVNAPTDTKQLTLAEKVSKKWDEAGIDEKFPPPKQ